MRTVGLVAGIAMVTAGVAAGAAQKPTGKTVKDGVFTAAQAARGEALYKKQCASCHAADMTGGQAPALAGADFLGFWDRTPVSDLVAKIQESMPQAAPGSLTLAQATDITAHVLRVNKYPAGAAALPPTAAAQKSIRIVK